MRHTLHGKKILGVAVLTASVIYSSCFFAIPVTFAASGGLDPADSVSVGIKDFTDAAAKYAHTGLSLWGIPVPFTSLDSIMKEVAKKIIGGLQTETLDWITGTGADNGNNGNPLFVTNPVDYNNQVYQAAGQSYLQDLSNGATGNQPCTYFKDSVVNALGAYYGIANTSVDSAASAAGSSAGGGAADGVSSAVSGVVGSLFGPSNSGSTSSNSTAGCAAEQAVGENNFQQFLAGNFTGGGGWNTFNAMIYDDNSNPIGAFLTQQSNMEVAIGTKQGLAQNLAVSGQYYLPQTNNGQIVTPAATVGHQIDNTLDSNLRQLEDVKNFDDIVSALADSLIDQVINGKNGLLTQGAHGDTGENHYKPDYSAAENSNNSSSSSSEPTGGTGDTSSGTPELQNVAIGGTATQSSTLTDDNGITHSASIALTQYNNRNPKFGGVSVTQVSDKPWWQVDLGQQEPIDHIDITPRGDGGGDELTNFYVIISKTPITGNSIPSASSNVWISSLISPAHPRDDITTVMPPAYTQGRYVRIQMTGSNTRLEVAGVQIFAKSVPVITLLGGNPLKVSQGTTFQDPGAMAVDPNEGDISSYIVTSGNVDTSKTGSYTITYTVENNQKVVTTMTRTVIVQ